MTPARTGGDRGHLQIDRVVPGVGRIKLSSGTSSRRAFAQLDGMIVQLGVRGRHDLLRGLVARRYTVAQLAAAYRADRFEELPTPEHLEPLAPRWTAWASGRTGESGRQLAYALDRLVRLGGAVTLADLPAALARYRTSVVDRPVFNRFRSSALAFLRDAVGRTHPLYRAAQAVPAVAESGDGSKGFPLAIATVREALAALDPDAAAILWTLCATGMRNKEFWEDGWEVQGEAVVIHGEKTEGSARRIPYWTEIHQPTLTEKQFRRRLARIPGDLVPYCGRKTFARWCEEAGIPTTPRMMYLGHKPQTMTDRYTRGEMDGQLRAHAALLAMYVQPVPRLIPRQAAPLRRAAGGN